MTKFIIIQQQDGSEQPFAEADLPIAIGSGPDAQIRLPGVEPLCAYIAQEQGHFYIQPAGSSEPLFHNDHYLGSSTWLKSHDTIRLAHFLVRYRLSGDRVIISVGEIIKEASLPEPLKPPSHPPPQHRSTQNGDNHIPVAVAPTRFTDRQRKGVMALTGLLFLLLGCAVFFVLSARPLQLNISPEPDNISFTGFPPPVKFGSRFLGLPGSYTIALTKDGYAPITRALVISESGDSLFSATLEKLPGILNLKLDPPERVAVYSDDHLLGTTPPASFEIAAGLRRIRLTRERYQPYVTEIEIEGMGKSQDHQASLRPDWAAVTITSEPAGASVAIDDKPAGATPLTLDLLSGSHALTLASHLFVDYQTTITVSAGKTAEHHISLQPLPGQLTLVSKPDRATVLINGEYKGSTPLTVAIAPDKEHEIVVSSAGFLPDRASITLSPGEKRQSSLTLEREKGDIFLLITPADAVVTLDGRPLAEIQGKMSLSTKPHTLEVKAAGYQSQSRTIQPRTGFSQQIAIDLEPLAAPPAPAAAETVAPQPQTTPAGYRLLAIQPFSFVMGAPRREPGRRANEHEQNITMSRPFYLSQKLVSNRQFRLFSKEHVSGSFAGNSLDGEDYPVVNITWEDAVSYLNWLSEQDGLKPFYQKQGSSFVAASPPTTGYRLPTEAEWAFSARLVGSPTVQHFPWSGGFPPRTTIGNFADESARHILPQIIDGYHDGFPVSSPVGTFPPNKGGFYDMGGNVGEWCHDFYSPYPGNGSPAPPTDPLGPPSGTHHVIRGSSWRDSSITELRLSYRAYHREGRDNVGFRVARYQ